MAVFCPNCSCPLQIGEEQCPKCGARFGPQSTSLPTTRPRGPVLTRQASDGHPRVQTPEERNRRRLYGLVIACIAVAWGVSIFREAVATLLALTVPGVSEERAAWLLSATLLTPMAQPAQPLPWLTQNLIPLRDSLAFYYALVALVLVQGALLLRRVVICKSARRIVLPPALNRALTILLLIGLVSWCIPVFVELLLRLFALGVGRPTQGVALAAGVLSAFVLPIVWIPAMNLLGPIFCALEMHSLVREGMRPYVAPSASDRGSPSTDFVRRSTLE